MAEAEGTTYEARPAVASVGCPICLKLLAVLIHVEYTIVVVDGIQSISARVDPDLEIDVSQLSDHMAFEHGVFE